MSDVAEIRDLARDFARAELRPHVEAWDAAAALGDDVVGQLAGLGFFGMLVPDLDGGMGFGASELAAALEEIAWGEPATALVVLAQQLVVRGVSHADDAARTEWLARLADGSVLGCYALAEEHTPTIVAEQHAGGWTVSGAAPWVLHHGRPGVAVVEADVAGEARAFAVALDGTQTRFGARVDTLGLRPLHVSPLHLDAAPAHVLDPAAGADMAHVGRIGVAAVALGIAQAALDHALAYAAQREQFQTRLRDFDAIRFKLADMAIGLRAGRALLLEAAAGSPGDRTAAMAKVFASALAVRATTEAVQVFGGYGYMRDYPVEKLMRDASAMGLLQGADERLRLDVATSLYHD